MLITCTYFVSVWKLVGGAPGFTLTKRSFGERGRLGVRARLEEGNPADSSPLPRPTVITPPRGATIICANGS